MDLPQFVQLQHDQDAKTALLSVDDVNVKEQKEMWGMSNSFMPLLRTSV
jgi:hypothetical protein